MHFACLIFNHKTDNDKAYKPINWRIYWKIRLSHSTFANHWKQLGKVTEHGKGVGHNLTEADICSDNFPTKLFKKKKKAFMKFANQDEQMIPIELIVIKQFFLDFSWSLMQTLWNS